MIKINNLTKIYKSKKHIEVKALDNVSFELPDKGLVFIIGKSGSGKSTLLNLLGGLDKETSGEINIFGNQINKFTEKNLYSFRSSMIGFIFQDFHLLDDLTVEENIALSLKLQSIDNKDLVNKVLEQVDLKGYNNRYPNELSGGQKQRVAIARALIKNPNMILADEPTGNLDSNTTDQIMNLIKKISKERLVVIVSHNLYDAYDYADRIIELSQGRIISDLIINEEYTNKIRIDGNKLILPLLRKFNKDELKQILLECKKENINEIEQDNNKFIKYQSKNNDNKKIEIKKSNLSIKDAFKFSYLFGKRRTIRFILSSMMAAMLIVVLALSQSIANFDDTRLIQEQLINNDSAYCIRKNIDTTLGENYLKYISDEEINELKSDNVDIYKLYNDSFYISGASAPSILGIPTYEIKDVYIGESNGVLVTNKEYAKKLLRVDELDIYTNNKEYKPYGYYITDYFADCLRFYKSFTSYDQILSSQSDDKNARAHINGIIKTNYAEKYKDLILNIGTIKNESEMTEEMVDFYDYLIQALGIGYSFDENYISESRNNTTVRNYQYTYKNFVNGKETTADIKYLSHGNQYGVKLEGNETYWDYEMYNAVFGTNYTLTSLNEFVPHEVHFVSSDYEEKTKFEMVFKIVEIGPRKGERFLVSEEVFIQAKKDLTICYGLYIDGTDLSDVIVKASNNNYMNISIKMSAVQTMSQAVSVFNKFFDLIVIILIIACAFILISFGVKNIRANMYEIGVLKALGCKLNNFIIMFGLHTLVIVMMVSLMSIVGYRIFASISNDILVESLHMLAPTYVIMNLNFIAFDFNLIFIDILLVLVISIISTMVPMLLLKRIKPIDIIKAKE